MKPGAPKPKHPSSKHSFSVSDPLFQDSAARVSLRMYLAYVLALLALTGQSVADVRCPDQESSCPDGATCCQLPTKQWGCCPMESAVCCKDGLHCCPAKTTCNLQEMTCENQTTTNPWLQNRPAKNSIQEPVICPDGKKVCPDENTCCKMGSPPDWGCCQFPHGVCCPDHIHCCPHGSTCNGSTCSTGLTPLGLAEPKMKCPDGTYCDNGSTCCQTEDSRFGCCPVVGAVCCPDKIHCCNSGYECDDVQGRCVRQPIGDYPGKARKWMKKYRAIVKSPVMCPDQVSQCPENTTCCQMESGVYGCCPMPEAVCCTDKIHCCPHGTTCDLQQQRCTKGTSSTPLFQKFKSYPINDVVCPDHKAHCPTGATCCPLDDTTFGCCPLPQAVCCEDHLHCCPTGTTCNLEEESCISARGTRVAWFLKFKPKQV